MSASAEAIAAWQREDDAADVRAVLKNARDQDWLDRLVDDPDDDNANDGEEAIVYLQLTTDNDENLEASCIS